MPGIKNALGVGLSLVLLGVGFPARSENLSHVRQLLSSRNCANCDLANSGLAYVDLAGADLKQANLRGANLSRSDLRGANLQGADLTGASLNGAILQSANLQGANLSQVDFRDAYVVGANFQGADLTNATLRGAIGLPTSIIGAKDLHNWGINEASQGNHQQAIAYYTQALAIDPSIAMTYFGRSLSYLQLNDGKNALADAKVASDLFQKDGNQVAYERAQDLIKEIERLNQQTNRPTDGGGFFNFLGSLLPLLLF